MDPLVLLMVIVVLFMLFGSACYGYYRGDEYPTGGLIGLLVFLVVVVVLLLSILGVL